MHRREGEVARKSAGKGTDGPGVINETATLYKAEDARGGGEEKEGGSVTVAGSRTLTASSNGKLNDSWKPVPRCQMSLVHLPSQVRVQPRSRDAPNIPRRSPEHPPSRDPFSAATPDPPLLAQSVGQRRLVTEDIFDVCLPSRVHRAVPTSTLVAGRTASRGSHESLREQCSARIGKHTGHAPSCPSVEFN